MDKTNQPASNEGDVDDGADRIGTLASLRSRWAQATAWGEAGAFHADMLSAIEKLISNDNPAVSARGRKLLCCAMCNLGPTPPTCTTCKA